MWRFYFRELPAIMIVFALIAGGIWAVWAFSDPPVQNPSVFPVVIVNFPVPVSKTAWARRDPAMGVTVQFADGSRRTVGMLMSLAQNCQVGDTVMLQETVSNAGAHRFRVASACVRPTP